MNYAKLFLFFCIAFIIGIAIASFLPKKIISNDIWFFGGSILFLVLAILFWDKKNSKRFNLYQFYRLFFLLGIFLLLGFWRYSISLPTDLPNKIWHYNGQSLSVVGVIDSEPDIRQNSQKLEVKVKRISILKPDSLGKTVPSAKISGKALVTTDLYPVYDYGDKLEIKCCPQTPESFNDFAYDRYLARYDIYSLCYYPEIKILSAGNGNWFYANIYKLKNKFRQIIDSGLGEPEACLAKAIILGDKKNIPPNLRKSFSQSGLSHIVAISGMHIGILAAAIMFLFLNLGLWRCQAFYFSVIFLFFYIIMIGAPASAIRAGLMGFLVLLALNLGRLNKINNSLALAAVFLLLLNPRLLRDDIGFQLSFLAVMGIVYFYPRVDACLSKAKIPKLKGLRGILSVTLAAQILVWPILAINFSQVSLIAPLSNLLVLWILPILMVAVLAAIALSFLAPSMAVLFFAPSKFLIDYIISVSNFLTKIPYSHIEPDYIWPPWLLGFYLAVFLLIIKFEKKI